MSKLWHYTNWAKPGTDPPQGYFDEPWEAMGFARMEPMFSGKIFPHTGPDGTIDLTGDFDRDQLRGHLDSLLIPEGSYVWLDVEYAGTETDPTGSKVVHWKPSQGAPEFFSPWQPGIDFWCDLLDFCRVVRPDCKFGPYGQVPHSRYASQLGDKWRGALDNLAAACRPIAERCDFLLPYLYDQSVWPSYNTLADRKEFWKRHIARAKYFFPDCELFGMTWPEYIDLWRARPTPDTVEAQNSRLMTGFAWQNQIETILDLCDGLMVWGGDGWTPDAPNYWKPDSEWVLATEEAVGTAGGKKQNHQT